VITEAKARQLLERVLGKIRATKGAEAAAMIRDDRAGNTRFARNEITSSADVERTHVAVTVQFGLRSASASTNQFDDHSLDEVVDRATRMARLAPENPEAMPVLGKQTYPTVPSAVDHATAQLGAAGRAKAVGAALAAGAKLGFAGFYEHGVSATGRATTAGLWAWHEDSSCSFSCTARTADGTGSGWAGTQSNKAGDFDPGALAKLAVEKALRSANPKKLDPGRYSVILEPAAVSPLLDFLIGSFGARRADEGRSFFTKAGGGTRVGEKLFPDTITLRTDPGDAAVGGQPFDGEGMPLAATKWIDKGTVTALTYGRYWAKKQNKKPTGSPAGWTLDGGTAKPEELVKGIKRGVLITRFWYLRDLDPQTILATGLTRDGTFLIENGEITHPVNNFRFNESPIHMLAKCDGLGAGWIAGGEGAGVRAPTLRTHEFNLASISEAI
jgi:predicted Zn-dependent protease